MTSSPAPRDEGDEPTQAGIWDPGPDGSADPADEAGPGEPRERARGRAVAASRGLTRTLTSTDRTPGPGGWLIADVPNRILALILDILALSLIGFLLAWFLGGLVEEPGAIEGGGGLDRVAFLVLLIVQLLVSFAYFAGSWTTFAATPGMRLLGLRVGEERDGRAITWRSAIVRWLLLGLPALLVTLAICVPDTVGLLLGAAGVAWLSVLLYSTAQGRAKRGWHDRYAHTIVVRARRATA